MGGDARADTKLEMGARVGYGIPFGDVSSHAGNELKRVILGQFPFWLDMGARLDERFFVGGYLDYGFGLLPSGTSDACKTDQAAAPANHVSCRRYDIRVGAEFLYHLSPKQQLDPWLGLGFGYEAVARSETQRPGEFSGDYAGEAFITQVASAHGFEFVNLQVGLDVSVVKNLAIGPFATLSLAQYRKQAQSCSGYCLGGGPDTSSDIHGKALHEWLLFGARATFEL